MAEDFVIRIRADDAATATVKKIQAALGKVTEPVEKSQKRLASLGQIGQASLGKLHKGFGRVESAARGVVDKIVEIIPGLSAIGGAASLAGLSALAVKFGNFGFGLNKSSKLLGMNAQDLAAWHVAAKRAGVSAEEFDSSMSGSQMAIRAAASGQDPHAMVMLQKMGVQIARNKDGTVDFYNTQLRLMKAIPQLKTVEAQRDAAGTFSMGGMLPMLQQGTYEADKARALRKGLVPTPEEIARAAAFHQNINDLEDSVGGLGNSIGSRLGPILDPLVTGFSKWLDGHRAQIADQIGSAVQKLANWLQNIDWDSVVSKTGKFFDAIGGVKGVLVAITAITFAGPISGVLGLITQLLSLTSVVIPGAITALGTLGGAGIAAWAALKVAKIAGLPDVDNQKGIDDVRNGNWVAASAHLPMGDFLRAIAANTAGVPNAQIAERLSSGANPTTGEKAEPAAAPAQPKAAPGQNDPGIAQALANAVSTPADAAERPPGAGVGISAALAANAGSDAVLAAFQSQQRYGVPAAVTLAQFGLESGFGRSGLARRSNNPFGMHAAPGQDFVWGEDDDGHGNRVPTKFAKFASIADAFDAHAKLLATGSAYAEARKHTDDPIAYAAALTGHYATDPYYGAKLQAMMGGPQAVAMQPLGPGQPDTSGAPSGAPQAAPVGEDRDARVAQMQQAAPQVGAQQQTASVQHRVTVDFKNVPQGVQVDAKSSDGGYLPTKINYAMGTNMGAMP